MREELSKEYIKGKGIEIGALCHPLPTDADVTYVDRLSNSKLCEQYPDIPPEEMVKVDLVDDGETLESFESNSQDFVIANHFLEHCKNPIKTIENWVRVLKSGGVIFCAVPDKETSFDKDREVTALEHLIEEYTTGETNDFQHYFDWSDNVGEVEDSMATAKHLMKIGYSIHYHVWDKKAIQEFFNYLAEIFPLSIERFEYNPDRAEFIYVMRKI